MKPATLSAIFSQMSDIARPIVQAFLTDLTTHDRATLERMADGELFMWIPYRSGTHMVRECCDERMLASVLATLEGEAELAYVRIPESEQLLGYPLEAAGAAFAELRERYRGDLAMRDAGRTWAESTATRVW
jgi:hypothetical protein